MRTGSCTAPNFCTPGYREERLFPMLRLAELRVRQGRFEEAERLLEEIDWHTRAKGSLARVALARGDLALAEDLVRLCLESTQLSDPNCPPLLGLLVEVQLARGDLAAADETLEQLARLASGSEGDRTGAAVRRGESHFGRGIGGEKRRQLVRFRRQRS